MSSHAPFAVGHRDFVGNGRSPVDDPVTLSCVSAFPDAAGTLFGAPVTVCPEPVAPTVAGDSVAGFKRVRRVRRSEAKPASIFRYPGLWFAPFLAEVVLLLGAVWLTVCLYRVMWTPGTGFPVLSFVLIAAAYVGLASYARAHEMLLPRVVVLIGVGTLALLAAGTGLMIALDAFVLGGVRRLSMAALVLIPVGLFLTRCALVFHEARFTPSVNELCKRKDVGSRRVFELRSKLRFWLS